MNPSRVVWLALSGLVLAACGAAAEDVAGSSPTPDEEGGSVVLEEVEAGPVEDVASALLFPADPSLPPPQVDTTRIKSGGPPPDGIPPIDQPRFEPAAAVDWLADDEPVVALSLGGQDRAYPVQIMMWHEIVNDTVDGEPVAVTYCPLCNSALAFDRRVGDRLLTFGTSGSLYLSALVMYDRQTESLWSQVERIALAGVLSGTELGLIPVSTVRWSDWREARPDGWVLSRDTGVDRDYGRNPYSGYDALDNDRTLLDQPEDGTLPAKERIVTFPEAQTPVAVRLSDLVEARVTEVEVDGEPVVLVAAPGLASALDDEQIAEGRQIAATGAFRPTLDGQRLTFTPVDDDGPAVVTDIETGSGWSILGRAVSGPLAGQRLEPVPHLDTFWFAQAAFEPDTTIIEVSP
jgi:hypothetical protein